MTDEIDPDEFELLNYHNDELLCGLSKPKVKRIVKVPEKAAPVCEICGKVNYLADVKSVWVDKSKNTYRWVLACKECF